MKQPPLLQSLYAVMFLAIVNLEVRAPRTPDVPGKEYMAFAAAALCFGALVQPLVQQKRGDDQEPAKPTPKDDLDLSA